MGKPNCDKCLDDGEIEIDTPIGRRRIPCVCQDEDARVVHVKCDMGLVSIRLGDNEFSAQFITRDGPEDVGTLIGIFQSLGVEVKYSGN